MLKTVMVVTLGMSLRLLFALETPQDPTGDVRPLVDQSITATMTRTVWGTVRRGTSLNEFEKTARQNRLLENKKALESFLSTRIETSSKVPIISICCSGGELEATAATLGLLKGLDAIKLLNAITYISTTGGSSWALFFWLIHNMDLDKIELYFLEKLKQIFIQEKIAYNDILSSIARKSLYDRPICTSDILGGLLGNLFLDENNQDYGQTVHLIQFAEASRLGAIPIPICNACIEDLYWLEFSPFEMGSMALQTWVNPAEFGKKFINGTSTDSGPGETLSAQLGMMSPSLASQTRLVYQQFTRRVIKYLEPNNLFCFCGNSSSLSEPQIHNFAYKIPSNPLEHKKHISFSTPSKEKNLPMRALLQRNTNLYIIIDTGKNNLLSFFDNISFEPINPHLQTVFYGEQKQANTAIIYIPCAHDISNNYFGYDEKKLSLIIQDIEKTVITHKETFKKSISYLIRQIGEIKKTGKKDSKKSRTNSQHGAIGQPEQEPTQELLWTAP